MSSVRITLIISSLSGGAAERAISIISVAALDNGLIRDGCLDLDLLIKAVQRTGVGYGFTRGLLSSSVICQIH